MGLGHALMEEMIYEDGKLRNGNMVDYKVPTFMDSDVEMKITLVEQAHPEGPYGVKGIGEPGLAPTAAAIVNAVCHACDADFTHPHQAGTRSVQKGARPCFRSLNSICLTLWRRPAA